MTKETLNIYQKLINIREEFHKLELAKSGKNKFANYDYFELKDFIPSVVKLLHKHGAVTLFNIDEVQATLTLINTENTEDKITFSTPVADASGKGQLAIQSLGSQHTYLKRYLYINLLDIVESDGIDGLSPEQKDDTQQPKVTIATAKQIETIEKLYSDEEIETMQTRMGKTINNITVQEASKMIKARSAK